MKNKQNPQANNTEQLLAQVLQRLSEIDGDLKKIYKELDITQKMIRIETTTSSLNTKHDVKEEMKKLHNEELNRLDFIVKELESLRQDKELSVEQTNTLEAEIQQLKERVRKLEKLQTAA